MKRLSFYWFILLSLVLVITGCQSSQSIGEKNIKGFLNQLYQIESWEKFEEFDQNIKEYVHVLHENSREGLVELEGELFESFLQGYRPYCTESALEQLASTGYLTRYPQKAYEDKCLYFIDKIELEKSKGSNLQYYFTVDVDKKMDDGTISREKGEGIIGLNGEGYVNIFKITKQLGN